jgi:hypothetical protein
MKMCFRSFESLPVHVVGRCPDPVWPAERLNDVWRIFGQALKEFEFSEGLLTHAFVLMRNHYHWLCSSARGKECDPKSFEWFHEAVTFDFVHSLQSDYILETGMDPPPLFEGPALITVLDHIQAYRQAYAYVYRNPVEAGIVDRAEQYPFSSLPYVLGRTREKLKFHCWDNMNLIQNPMRTLEFINGLTNG